ncbi:malto-oligosyltrehalose synthase [Pedobacter metabolipauper]|uniref:4-alpha-glucanotransferase n=1 Tax=Pedobacter metabolipauper TaxID=425513 RepID=A0A4R6SX74_9SPHI|nr:malto-oligosyltrehalose synthase [Pedobacter metabolipauper]TDQ10026.1 4-alpha-glucanotransferase/malto-oligosyltrehalose synthase,TIGR02401 [Pedobacter metabolipauper]
MFDPISTYRIQFNSDFTFADFNKIIPYLNHLGIQTIYASPIFDAVPGSTHGYDGVNPERINPEIGSLDELKRISERLKSLGMQWIQDIVPNHMGFHPHNKWLMDVLKNGEDSPYRNYFDIISKDLAVEPLMVPFLGSSLDEVIESGDLKLTQKGEEWFLAYFDSCWPLKVGTDLDKPIKSIAGQQFYRLCSYKESNERINYRRFFTVNSLICLNMQFEDVFNSYHRFTKELLDEGIFQGLRIDHADGLYDPEAYLQQLRELCGPDCYIVIEKILEPGEELPVGWPVQGTTGYDYLGLLNQLFTNEKSEKKFDEFYKNLSDYTLSVQTEIRTKKKSFLANHMSGELDNLFDLFRSLKLVNSKEKTLNDPLIFKKLIAEILVRCPVYRFYGNQYPLPTSEVQALEPIFSDLEKAAEYRDALAILKRILFGNTTGETDYGQRVLQFYQRLMQFTGPLMAKGVEDTLMYTYNRFIGSNEVGDSPDVFGITVDDFHQAMISRKDHWPLAMNATSTHDTKRGEDARARLHVLTDLKKEWLDEVKLWKELNADLKSGDTPDTNDEYLIYQNLIATYPDEGPDTGAYPERFLAYIEKALRESKRNSNWDEPEVDYEDSARDFVTAMLNPEREFWSRFVTFHKKVSQFGKIYSLSSVVLKFGCPGVPDTYQGAEFWDLSMVDPDNRRPVNYALREKFLTGIRKGEYSPDLLWEQAGNGAVKLFFIQLVLGIRKQYPLLFSDGLYLPLKVKGKFSDSVIAFVRRHKGEWLLFVLPLNAVELTGADPQKINHSDWQDTRIVLPEGIPSSFKDVLRETKTEVKDELMLSDLMTGLPIGIFHFQEQEHKRGAGILMHISSLPSDYGIGDLGNSAHEFLQFLVSARQKYWQVLPMNPVGIDQSYSPYSSSSVMAGNILMISPELLCQEGLLTDAELKKLVLKGRKKVDYAAVEKVKLLALKYAYIRYCGNFTALKPDPDFVSFCERERYWLDDYALFSAFKREYNGKPWYEWPMPARLRDKTVISDFELRKQDLLTEIKWQQFVFFKQWAKLKKMANALNIQMIGDLPFYAALDSADVWANRELFSIDAAGQIKGVAGVPPDYFNAEGQLWGMPVYNWNAMSKKGYNWWILRMASNLEMYDQIRLDHFRAFSEYWEVPASAASAKEGSWKKGPGVPFFEVMEAHFGHLPLLAEDLGEISDDVYALRDQFNLPGMKVLQFAFADDLADSIHAPHNFLNDNCFVYTGTHDNNTTLGWYKQEADRDTKARIEQYTGHPISKGNIDLTMIRLAYSSIAKTAMIPLQDVLGKGLSSRMNTPATVKSNWTWRLKPAELGAKYAAVLKEMVIRYGR